MLQRDTLHLIARLSGWIARPDLPPTLVSDIRAARDAISRMAEMLDEMAGEMRKAGAKTTQGSQKMNDTPRTTIRLPFTPEDIRAGRVIPADDVMAGVDAPYNLLLRIHAVAVDALTEIASGSLPDPPAASGLDGREWAMQHIARLRRLARHGLIAAHNIRFNETPSPKLADGGEMRKATGSRIPMSMTDENRLPCDDAEVMRLWREAGLPEYFLGNGGSNYRLVAFVEKCRAAMLQPARDCDASAPEEAGR